ncbi:MAG: hypothetical protein GXP47_03275 [Acidobacteria bacterium]|nr:hypothetical protein [Acidobacteriota bacterium]
MELAELLQVLAALARYGVDYVLVGGAALNIHGIIRATEDADLFVKPERENIERLKNALKSVYHDSLIDEITADDLLGEYPAVRYYPPTGSLFLDVLTRLGEAFTWEDLEHEKHVVEGVPVIVATPATLFRMKRNTVRLQDRADAERLREEFDLGEQP